MRRIGEQALTFRFPAVTKRESKISYIGSEEFLGQWVVLSFVPGLRKSDRVLWNEQGKDLEELGVALLLVPSEAQALHQERNYGLGQRHFTIVGDPLGRLNRLYGGPVIHSSERGRTFLIDPGGILRFHLVHNLNERGMAAIMELVQAFEYQEVSALM